MAASMAALASGCGSGAAPASTGPPGTRPVPQRRTPAREQLSGRCFGAAAEVSRGAGRCNDRRFTTMVYPAPQEATTIISPSPCRHTVRRGLVRACWWGAPGARARRTVALIGDSHASVWRPAFEHVVRARGWRAVSLSRAGCPLTLAHPRLPGAQRRRGCMEWNRQVQAWVGRHRRVSVVFLAAHRGHVVAPPGQAPSAAQRAGYAAAIRGLLRRGVARVVVLRDTPRNAASTLGCIE